MAAEHPTRFLAHLKIAEARPHFDRLAPQRSRCHSRCKLLTPGSTRCDSGDAGDVGRGDLQLDPSRFTVRTVPERLGTLKQDSWQGFENAAQRLPDLLLARRTPPVASEASGVAPAPKPRSSIVNSPAHPNRGAANQFRCVYGACHSRA
jgi:hypothetical protein